ncbi:DUF2029 domain-containing protein [Ensifer sp. IC3342]|nr:DUF2029 domain-containing protein [Ensifer sp. BRP08]MCA1447861.1 DUF2029 domain-containing protein [Ensifer sp. IC3342]
MTDNIASRSIQAARTPFPAALALTACLAATAAWILVAMTDTGTVELAWSNRDFANYWIAARLALEGRVHDVFSAHAVYFAHMQAAFGSNYPWHAWSYPPHYLLTVLPFGWLGYKNAMVAYLLLTFLLLCAAIRLAAPAATSRQLLWLLLAILTNAMATQNGFLTSALLLVGLAGRFDRPVLAGICIGLLTIKPQLGLLLPLLLLYERRWLVITVASVTALGLVAVSMAAFGFSSWQGFMENVVPYQTGVMRRATGIFLHMMPSVFGSLRSLGFSSDIALAAHVPVAVAALILWLYSLPRLQGDWARAASTTFATFVITPYSLSYDLVILAAVAAFWPLPGGRPTGMPLKALLLATAAIPVYMPVLGLAGLPGTPLLILPTWILLLINEGALAPFIPRTRPAGT